MISNKSNKPLVCLLIFFFLIVDKILEKHLLSITGDNLDIFLKVFYSKHISGTAILEEISLKIGFLEFLRGLAIFFTYLFLINSFLKY